ncbi:hypothetical protein V498_06612 [Pseudogymnoascus sp. VKM F-4517 (FW-2822)]|nr:hypothetical protein V498_06612 [Pseudogymnoascus sp. VKM F-4517 (FW-2822)]
MNTEIMESEKKTIGGKIKYLVDFFFGDDATTKEERRLVQKLADFVSRGVKVAGLREALDMSGSDYNTVLSVTTAGMAIGQIPHGIIIQKIRPGIWLPSMMVIWAGLTMVTAAVNNLTQLCVVRFFLGLAEASTYSGTIYIIGSWYKPEEIGRRTALFTASGQVGTMFAGVMMTAIYQDGIITLPIAIFGFLCFPDIPEITKAKYLTPSEKDLALSRLPPVKQDGHNISPWSLLKRVILTPTTWILFFWSPVCATIEAFAVQNIFLLWLKYHSARFTQNQINTYPLGVQAVGIVANMLAAWHMDATGTRVPMVILAVILQLVSAIMLIIPTLSFAGTFFAFYLSGTAYMVNPLIFGWASIILQRGGDDAVRSVTVYAMNVGSMVMYTFWGIVLYPADDAPYWKKGSIAMIIDKYTLRKYSNPISSGDTEKSVNTSGKAPEVGFQIDKYTLRKYSNPISSGDTEKSVNTSGKAPEVENLEMSNNK